MDGAGPSGKRITTIEGFEESGRLHAVQEAFLKEEAFQCGSGTSGMILTTAALLARRPHPADAEIVARSRATSAGAARTRASSAP